jgi:hypothetical protein
VDNRQLDAAAAGAELDEPEPDVELELLPESLDELELDESVDEDAALDDPEPADSELFAEPLLVLLAASRLSVR